MYPANIYLFKYTDRNTRKLFKICSKSTLKSQERRQCHHSVVFIANFEHISNLFVVFLLLTKWLLGVGTIITETQVDVCGAWVRL